MYIAILDNNIEEARIYENLTVLNTDLKLKAHTLANFFSRNKGKFYKRGNLTVIKSPVINRRFLMALSEEKYNPKVHKLDKIQKEELEFRKEQQKLKKELSWNLQS